jgi:hypothetical protein
MAKTFVKLQVVVKTKLNLSYLKQKFNADGNSIIHIEIYDDNMQIIVYELSLRVGNDSLIVQYDTLIKTDYETIINLINGNVKRIDNKIDDYNIIQAYREGKIFFEHKTQKHSNYLGDLALFETIFEVIKNDINKK